MKTKYFVIAFLAVFIQSITSCAQQKISVLTFNIWDPNDEPFWKKYGDFPVDDIVTYLSENKADILLLQEVSLENGQKNQTYQQIKTKLEKKGYIYSAFYRPNYKTGKGDIGYYDGMKNSGYPLAILSKYPILETFANQYNNKVKMSKGVLGIKISFNKQPLYIFNTHFTIGAKDTDAEMEKVTMPFINNIAGNSSVIFGGDFNSPPATDYPNSEQTIGKYVYSSTTDQFLLDDGFVDVYPIAVKERNVVKDATCPGQDDYMKRVDRVYFRNTDLYPIKAFVKSNPWEYVNLVDHRGVYVEFKIKKNEPN